MAFDTQRNAVVYLNSVGVVGHAWLDGNFKFGVPSATSIGLSSRANPIGGTNVWTDIQPTASVGVALNLWVDSSVYPGTPGQIMLVKYESTQGGVIQENWTRM